MPGPPKTPTHLALVKGNPSKRPINKNEPKPPSGVPPIRDITMDGANWFNMPLLTPLGQQDYVCRFTDDFYEGPTPEGGKYWRYTATLELWERPILPPGWAEFPDFIVNSDILDLAVNREWPEA